VGAKREVLEILVYGEARGAGGVVAARGAAGAAGVVAMRGLEVLVARREMLEVPRDGRRV